MDKKKILFIDISYKTLFFIEDGDDVEVEIQEGEWKRFKCRYIDETHFYFEDQVYHISQFAQVRGKYGQQYRPAKPLTVKEAV